MQETNTELFAIFKQFFEDASIKKVWHNYSFDRHVLRNHGIDCRGFAADTMHMARLWDSSRQGKGYSLESLTGYAPEPRLLKCLPDGNYVAGWATGVAACKSCDSHLKHLTDVLSSNKLLL